MLRFVLLTCLATTCLTLPTNTVDVITEPKPGQEYVFVQSSGSGSRPIERKDKVSAERPFETAHKLPPSLTYALNKHDAEEKEDEIVAKKVKREAAERPAPAPAGAIKLDVHKLLEKYKTELKTTSAPTTTPKSSTTTKKSSRRRNSNRRIKKEAREEIGLTNAVPVLTTSAPTVRKIDDDDIPLVGASSEKQRSRIQIKKGPNGQEYEYEYVYYYYDDDEEGGKGKPEETNAHDGPAKSEKKSSEPEVNEVVPASRTKTRGRQLGDEETVNEERLPANTRFPPRSRNLNTTPLPEEETKVTAARGRGRGRPSTETAPTSAETDNVSDETQGSRGRTRANVRRPSLDFVDSETFNTHNSNGAEPPANGPTFPTDLPAGPVRFLGATPNERIEITEEKGAKQSVPVSVAPVSENVDEGNTSASVNEETTTVMSAMDKVALDLYAILQGTQKLSGEEDVKEGEESDGTTVEIVTDVETTTPTTTTTSTTTTTPAPTTTSTTTTTTEAPTGRNRYRNRGNSLRKPIKQESNSAATSEAPSSDSKPKSKFGRNSFGSGKRPHHARTTAEPEVAKEEVKPVSNAKPTLSRSRFGASRPRGRTTAAPSEEKEQETSSAAPATNHHKASLPRTRPSFNGLRSRTRTTAAPTEDDSSSASSETNSETTTARNRRISAGSNVRPLRPGPRINLNGARGRASSTTTEAAPVEDHVTGDESAEHVAGEESEEKQHPAESAPVDNTPLGRLRNKNRLQVKPKAAAAASAPVQVRRSNPLLSRRRPGHTTEATSSEAPQEQVASTDAPTDVAAGNNEETVETEVPASSSTTTTEEPRGLNKLLAGRRRLAAKQAGTNH